MVLGSNEVAIDIVPFPENGIGNGLQQKRLNWTETVLAQLRKSSQTSSASELPRTFPKTRSTEACPLAGMCTRGLRPHNVSCKRFLARYHSRRHGARAVSACQ